MSSPETVKPRQPRWRWVALATVIGVVTLSLVFLAGRMTSPAQRAADAAPPALTPATATIEMRSVATTIYARGSVGYAGAVQLTLPSFEG